MKVIIITLTLFSFLSCTTKPKVEKQTEKAQEKIEKVKTVIEVESKEQKVIKKEKDYSFDNSTIPTNLIQYIKQNLDSVQIPMESDYEIDYFKNNGRTNLPYFCSGYFNTDSIRDYAMVLIKDSLNHYVFAFHSSDKSFKPHKICKSPFLSEYNSKRTYAVFDLETETERKLEAIDTTYFINSDGIAITNIYESRTKLSVWNVKQNKYEELLFD